MARTGGLLQETTSTILIFSPEHAHLLADSGWDRSAVRRFLYENAAVSGEHLARVGKDGVSRQQRLRLPIDHPDASVDECLARGPLRVLCSPDVVNVVVAGAPNCGISAVVDGHGVGIVPPSTAIVSD